MLNFASNTVFQIMTNTELFSSFCTILMKIGNYPATPIYKHNQNPKYRKFVIKKII